MKYSVSLRKMFQNVSYIGSRTDTPCASIRLFVIRQLSQCRMAAVNLVKAGKNRPKAGKNRPKT